MNSLVSIFSNPNGRLNRSRFWIGVLLIVILAIVIWAVCGAAGLTVTSSGTTTRQMDGGPVTTGTFFIVHLLPWAGFALNLLTTLPLLLITVKRRHDRGNSGADAGAILILNLLLSLASAAGWSTGVVQWLIGFDTLAYLYLFVMAGCLKGTVGPNQYGPDPLAG